MKARRSMVSHRNTFKYSSPVVISKRFSTRHILEDQENIVPQRMEDDASLNSAKRRKLYNGQAAAVVDKVIGSSLIASCPSPGQQSVDMDTSSVITPKRMEQRNSFIFTPPNRQINGLSSNGGGSFSTPRTTTSYKPPAKTIQDVFRNVTVYVEVKTIDEDRSDKIKAVAAQMGAQVNDKLYKTTTHVIFREGSMTTYKKALKMGIPLVSVTWLEECRKTLSLVDPARFLPINLEPYERPDLYKRVRKAAPSNGEVTTTPERFALKPTRPEDELEKALLEFQQTKLRLELDSPTSSSTSQLGRTALNFSPIGESTKIGFPKTPNGQSNVTPLLRRLMIRNAEEDRRERDNILIGRSGSSATKPIPVLEHTKYDRMSMDLSSMWGADDSLIHKPQHQVTDNSMVSMVEDTVDLTTCSPDTTLSIATKPIAVTVESKSTPSSIMRALRRQTLHFTQNASLDISPQLPQAKENVAASVNTEESLTPTNNSSFNGGGLDETLVKVPKICGMQVRKSLEEDTLREDIVRAREELLGKAVVINKSDKRRSLLPMSMGSNASNGNAMDTGEGVKSGLMGVTGGGGKQVNRRRTLFNVNAISEGGLTTPEGQKGVAKVAPKRRTLLPGTSSSSSAASSNSTQSLTSSPNPTEKKKSKKSTVPLISGVTKKTNGTTNGSVVVPGGSKPKQSLGASQLNRKGTNMGPPAQVPPVGGIKSNGTQQQALKNNKKSLAPPAKPQEEVAMKRKLFNSVTELSPVSSPVQSPATTRLKVLSKPFSPHSVQLIKDKTMEASQSIGNVTSTATEVIKRPPKKCRRSTLDFQQSTTSNGSVNSSTASLASRGSTFGGVAGGKKNVIVMTNGHGRHLEFIKELTQRLGGNFEVDTRVTSKTTHLVCVEKKRNMNMLRSVIRGIWVLDYDWVVKSEAQGKWQREEEFQVDTFGSTLTRVRSERQAFGPNYKMELFSGTGKYFVYETTTVPVHHLKELIMLCGGIVVEKASEAKYLIADKVQKDVQVISPSWVFDCVCQYAFLNHRKYLKK